MVFNLRTFSFTESVEGDSTPPTRFSLKELRVATSNFSRNNLLWNSWDDNFYRGRLVDGSLVAVKRGSYPYWKREEDFEAEVRVGSTVSTHPSVLCLRGFCRTKEELLLVYPLMINNSLSYNLRERPDRSAQPLDWTTRKRIALGAARGLAHLHNQGNIKVMHRKICGSSILLNEHFEAVIGGFSFAMIMHEGNVEEGTIEWPTWMSRRGEEVSFSSPEGENSADSDSDSQSYHRYEDIYVDTVAAGGTPGFISPEYIFTGKCTLKNDVFAYGRMLLELISGQSLGELRKLALDEDLILDGWICDCMNKNELGRVIDPNLQGNYVEEEAEFLAQLALLCSHEDPSTRPSMSAVVRMLESQFLRRNPSSRSSWSQSEGDFTLYYSVPPSPLGIAP